MPEIVDGFGRERQPLAAGLALSATRNSHRECSGGAVTTLVLCISTSVNKGYFCQWINNVTTNDRMERVGR
jgi:hypothetical protein